MLSDEWRIEAVRAFPEIAEKEAEDGLGDWDNPYDCWISLLMNFEEAYNSPRNEDLIRRIYEYSEWCLEQPRGETAEDDLFTVVVVCFYEHIPTIPEAVEDMPRWIPYETVKGSEEALSYLAGKEGYNRVLEIYRNWEDSGIPMAKHR